MRLFTSFRLCWTQQLSQRCHTERVPAGLDGNPRPITSPQREAVLAQTVETIARRRLSGRPFLIAIDGIDGAGKTTFADELAQRLLGLGVRVVRSTVDSFHHPRTVRHRRGATSPVGFYFDSHDLDALRDRLLVPFRRGAGSSVVTAVFDEPTDAAIDAEPRAVGADDVLLFDGIFVQRPELREFWDLVVFLDAAQRVNLQRLELVLSDLPTTPIDIVGHVLEWGARIDRYASGMRYYLDVVDPAQRADVLVDNNDLHHPIIVRGVD